MTATALEIASPLPNASGDADAIAAALADPRQRIEAAFVDVGGRLMQCAGLLNRLTGLFETLPKDLESPELAEATEQLAAVGRSAREIAESFAAEHRDLTRLVQVVTAAEHPISDLRRAVKMMGIVAVNARVVAAGIVGDSDDFDVFTTDIATLSDSAAHTIQDFSAVYRQLVDEVHRAADHRADFEAAHAGTLSQLTAKLEDMLQAVTDQRTAAAEGSAETGRVSRHISERIASAVMALQVGDATRQRIEHIETALSTLGGLSRGELPDGVDFAFEHLPDATAAISALSSAQLEGASSTFAGDVAEAEQALDQLASDARTIMAHSRDIYACDINGQSALTTLGTELRRAAAMLRDCEAERRKLEGVLSAVEATVGVLLQHVESVQEIEANMRLVSLNAAVKCAQLGPRGSALNVIARQLRELTGETVEAAHASMGGLSEASALARSFSTDDGDKEMGQVALLERDAFEAIHLLEGVDKRLNDALSVLNRDGPTAIEQLSHAAAGFSGHAAISEAMSDIGLTITAMCETVPNLIAAGRICEPLLHKLYRTYTMEAERRTHQQLFGSASIPAAAVVTTAAAESALDDMFFDDAPPPAAQAEPAGELDDIFF